MTESKQIKEIILRTGGPLDRISKNNPEKAKRLEKELQYMNRFYISASNKYCCVMSMYSLEWFYDLCEDLQIEPQCLSCYQYYSRDEFYSVEWVEHDLIIAFDKI